MKMCRCSGEMKLYEIDKHTYTEYNGFIFKCDECDRKDCDLIYKDDVDNHIARLKSKGVITSGLRIRILSTLKL